MDTMEKTRRRALFIDRDGTIIKEPPDEQVDSLEKLEFLPGAITSLARLSRLDYELVMVTNQDGLGTAAFPLDTFRPPHERMLSTLSGEGVVFDDILIDRTFPCEGAATRKPGTGMLGAYLTGDYALEESFVIGDRLSDVLLARNLGAKAICLSAKEGMAEEIRKAGAETSLALLTPSWSEAAAFLHATRRTAERWRNTSETKVHVSLDLDGGGETRIATGLHFLDHMLSQLPHHAGISLVVECTGDLEVDEHHTMEDVAITLGETLLQALGDGHGMERYGFALPMDESEAMVLLDLGGRSDFAWQVPFTREYVGDVPTEMFRHFFQSLSSALRCNLHIEARGENNHHLAESVFKAFARTLRQALRREPFACKLPSSKGVLH